MADPLEPPRPALPRRLAAMIYDILLVLPLVMVSVALVMGLRSLLGFGLGSLIGMELATRWQERDARHQEG